jgi:hypothetical protein
MAVDTATITTAITEGSTAAVLIAVAWGAAWWAVKCVKLIRDDVQEYYGEETDTAPCAGCDRETPDGELEEHGWMCAECYEEGLRLCRRCGDSVCEDPEYPICNACER